MNCSKIRLYFVAMFVLTTFNVQPTEAQFLKKLAKAAGKWLDSSSGSSSSNNSSSNKSLSSSNQSRTSKTFNGVDINITDATRFGDYTRVGFVIKNTSEENLRIKVKNAEFVCGNNVYGLSNFLDIDWGTDRVQRIPARTRIKGNLYVKDLPNNINTIDKVKLYADYGIEGSDYSADWGWSYKNVTDNDCKTIQGTSITPLRISNGCYSTYPDATIDVKSFQRIGTTVTLHFLWKMIIESVD